MFEILKTCGCTFASLFVLLRLFNDDSLKGLTELKSVRRCTEYFLPFFVFIGGTLSGKLRQLSPLVRFVPSNVADNGV